MHKIQYSHSVYIKSHDTNNIFTVKSLLTGKCFFNNLTSYNCYTCKIFHPGSIDLNCSSNSVPQIKFKAHSYPRLSKYIYSWVTALTQIWNYIDCSPSVILSNIACSPSDWNKYSHTAARRLSSFYLTLSFLFSFDLSPRYSRYLRNILVFISVGRVHC